MKKINSLDELKSFFNGKQLKIHYSKLNSKDVTLCNSCGEVDTIRHTEDCGHCTECYAVEDYRSRYEDADGNLYADKEINWDDEANI